LFRATGAAAVSVRLWAEQEGIGQPFGERRSHKEEISVAMITYTIDEAERLICVLMSGENSCNDLAKHYTTVLNDPKYDPTLDSLFVIADDASGPILSELPEVGTVLELLSKLQTGRKWAVVMTPGFKRVLLELMLKGVKLGTVQMRFVDDEKLGLAWLRQKQSGG
jgi:hypothetical protein